MATKHRSKHIKLTSHPGAGGAKPIPIHWGAPDPHTRGPIIATLTTPEHRNVIGTHSGRAATTRRSTSRTECVAGVQDMRFQELMPDVLRWLGIKKIHRLVSMSNVKYDAIVRAGIEVGERIRIPDELIPADARVEMDASTLRVLARSVENAQFPTLEPLYGCQGCTDDSVHTISAQIGGARYTVIADGTSNFPSRLQPVIDTLFEVSQAPLD